MYTFVRQNGIIQNGMIPQDHRTRQSTAIFWDVMPGKLGILLSISACFL